VRIEDLQLAMVNRILPEMGLIVTVIEMLEVGKSGVFVSMADVCVKSPRTGLLRVSTAHSFVSTLPVAPPRLISK
jgi:hypothetical protein